MSEEKKEKADLRGVEIKNAKIGVNASDIDLNMSNFKVSDTESHGIVHEGTGNVSIVGGIINNAGGDGIRIIGPSRIDTREEKMSKIQKYVNEQLETSLKSELNRHIKQYHETTEEMKKTEIFKSLISVMIQRGLGAFLEQLGKRSGDSVPLG